MFHLKHYFIPDFEQSNINFYFFGENFYNILGKLIFYRINYNTSIENDEKIHLSLSHSN